ncbi:MAG: hypothetical protein R2748_24240 [Bryobacterales bacterium]
MSFNIMSARFIWLAGFGALFLGLAVGAVVAAETSFQAQTADRYPSKQSQAGVTVAVRAYHEPAEREKSAFEKTDPWKYGVLPVLVVITNQGDAPIALQNLEARFVQGRGEGVDPTSGDDLQYFNPKGAQPRQKPSYIPGIPGLNRPKVKKGPLAKQEIVDRQFKAGRGAGTNRQRLLLLLRRPRPRSVEGVDDLHVRPEKHADRPRPFLLRSPARRVEIARPRNIDHKTYVQSSTAP